MNLPKVTIITPTFNESRNIRDCINSVSEQNYPKNLIEIIVVDDKSSDDTVRIAKELGAKIIISGYHHIEKSKSIGISHAKGKYLFFLDADLKLVSKNFIRDFITSLEKNKEAVGAQAIYWKYSEKHNLYDRYCELFGVNDPFVYMLGKRGVLSLFENKWTDTTQVLEENDYYFLAKFNENDLPTLGSQGYITRLDLIKKNTSWEPYFFHLDTIMELVKKKKNKFLLMKYEVEHKYVSSFFDFHKKLSRNLKLFLKYRKYRKYDYGVNSFNFIFTTFLMVTVIYPLFISIRGFIKKPDVAWFLHPIFCITVPCLYVYISILNKLKNEI